MATKKEYFEYDGQRLHWRNPRDGNPEASYRATSGLEGHQVPADQCLVNTGPVPAGKYKVAISRNVTYAQLDGDPRVACRLKPGTGLQIIPRGNECETWFANWGHNRSPSFPPTTAP